MYLKIKHGICCLLLFSAALSFSQPNNSINSTNRRLIDSNSTVSEKRIYYPVRKDQKWGLIDTNGTLVVKPLYDAISDFNKDGFAFVHVNDLVGIINPEGTEIIPPEFEDIKTTESIYFIARKDKLWGVFTNAGKLIIPAEYEELVYIGNRLFMFRNDTLSGILNTDNKIIIEPQFESTKNTGNGFIITKLNNLLGLYDYSGKRLLENSYSNIEAVNENYAVFRTTSGNCGGIFSDGQKTPDTSWLFYKYSPNMVAFNKENWHLFSLKNRTFHIRESFDFIEFIDHFAFVKYGNKQGVACDSTGIIIPVQFDHIIMAGNRGFMVDSGRCRGFYSLSGKIILPVIYDEIVLSDTMTYLTFRKNNLWGIASADGKIIIPAKGNDIELYPNRIKLYRKDKLYIYYLDKNGSVTDSSVFYNVHKINVVRPYNQTFTNLNNRTFQYYGWYYSGIRWGLRDSNKNVVIEPIFTDITLIPGCPLTLVSFTAPYKEVPVLIAGKKLDINYYYGLVDHIRCRYVTRPRFLDIRLSDFANGHNVARVITTSENRFGYILRNGRIVNRDIGYISEFADSMLAVNYKGKVEPLKKAFHEFQAGNVDSICLKLDYLNFEVTERIIPTRNSVSYETSGSRKSTLIAVNGGTWGFLDNNGNLAVPAVYSKVRDFKIGRAIVQKGGKWGIIDKHNRIILNFDFDEIENLNSNDSLFRLVKYSGKTGLIDHNGKVLCESCFEKTGKYSEGLVRVMIKGRWGYADNEGKIIIEPVYNDAGDFSEGLAAVKTGRKWGYIDEQGNTIIKPLYRKCGSFKDGLAWIIYRSRSGYIDKSGNIAIPLVYNECSDFDRGRAIVRKNSKFGIIDEKGRWITRPVYSHIAPYNQYGLAIVKRRYKCGLVDMKGKKVTSCRYRKIGVFSEGLAVASLENRFGYLDTNGKAVIDFLYESAQEFSDGLAGVRFGKAWGFIDKNGKVVVSNIYNHVYPFSENRAVVVKDRNLGLIDRQGKEILKTNNSLVESFSENRAFIKNYVGAGYYIDTNGNKAFSLALEYGRPFFDGKAIVYNGSGWGIIDRYGNYTASPNYLSVSQVHDTIYNYKLRGYNGVCDAYGNIFLEPVYESLKYFGNRIFKVEQANKTGYIRMDKTWLWRPTQ